MAENSIDCIDMAAGTMRCEVFHCAVQHRFSSVLFCRKANLLCSVALCMQLPGHLPQHHSSASSVRSGVDVSAAKLSVC